MQIEDVPAFIRQTHDAVQEARARGERVELAVWPETMLPSVGFEIGDEFSDAIERTVEALGVPMLVGSPCYLGVRRDETGTVTWDLHYNSAYLVGGEFLDRAPNSPHGGDHKYGFVEMRWTF